MRGPPQGDAAHACHPTRLGEEGQGAIFALPALFQTLQFCRDTSDFSARARHGEAYVSHAAGPR